MIIPFILLLDFYGLRHEAEDTAICFGQGAHASRWSSAATLFDSDPATAFPQCGSQCHWMNHSHSFKFISEGNHGFFIGNHPDPSWRGRLLKTSQNKATVVYIYIFFFFLQYIYIYLFIYKNIWWGLSFMVLSVLIMFRNNILEHEWQLRTKKNSSVRCYCSIFLGLLFLCHGRWFFSGMLIYPIS